MENIILKYEVARKEFITAEERAKEIFAEEIIGSLSAVFTDTSKSSVLAVCGLKFFKTVRQGTVPCLVFAS